MTKRIYLSIILACFVFVSGCSLERPYVKFDDATPINWGMRGAFHKGITVLPFDTAHYDKKWGIYAAKKMKEYLLETRAFDRVISQDTPSDSTQFILKGRITYLWYGGSYGPSDTSIEVRVIDKADGKTRFLKQSTISYERRAYSISRLMRLYISSPIPEQLLNGLLRHIAEDIAQRTHLPSE